MVQVYNKKMIYTSFRSLSIVIGIFIFTASLANGMIQNLPREDLSGFFSGVALNYLAQKAYVHMDMDDTLGIGDLRADPVNFDSCGGTVFLGYGKQFKKTWYLGVEASYRYSDEKNGNVRVYLSSYGYNYSVDFLDGIKAADTFSGFIKGGYIFTPQVMGYILLGISSTRFEYTSMDVLKNRMPQSDRLTALTPGLGLQIMVTPHIFIDTRYTYTTFSDKKHTVMYTYSFYHYYDEIQFQPTINAFSLGIGYLF